jgi:hypothetical protein
MRLVGPKSIRRALLKIGRKRFRSETSPKKHADFKSVR